MSSHQPTKIDNISNNSLKESIADANFNFEQAVAELEAIVAKMETGELPLDIALDAYKRGAALVSICQKVLNDAEQQVRILSESNKLNVFTDHIVNNSTAQKRHDE